MNTSSSNILHLFFHVIIIIISHNLSAQVINETTSVKILEQLILENNHSNPELAKSYANILLKKCRKENNDNCLVVSFYQLGRNANIQGNYSDAIVHSNIMIQIAKKFKDKTYLFEALLTKGNAYFHLGNNEEALSNYMEALTIAKSRNGIVLKVRVSENIAKIKERIGQPEDALKTYKNNLKLTKKITNNKLVVINTLMGIGRVYLQLNQPDSTLFYANKGLKMSEEINNLEGVSYFYNDIGKAYFKKELFHEAIKSLKKSERLILQLNNKTRLTETCYFIGYAYYKLNDLDNAIDYFKKVEQTVNTQRVFLENNFNPPELLSTYKLMGEAYKAQHKNIESSIYTQKYIALDEYNDLSKNKIVKELFEIKENELQSSLNVAFKQKNKVRYLLIFISLMVLLSLLVAVKFVKDQKQNKLAFQRLLKTNKNVKLIKKEHELIIKDEKATAILQGLDKLEQTHYFLNTNCSLPSMAKKLKTNTTYLSKMIHEYKQKSFYQYLNGLRIHYAIQRLKEDRIFRNYSVECISQEIGYKSTNSFTKHFKAHTKLYPSYYIKNLSEYE